MAGSLDYEAERARGSRRRAIAAGAAAAIVLIALAAWFLLGRGPGAEGALDDFAAALEAGDPAAAAALTDADPRRVQRAIEANVAGLDDASVEVDVAEVEESGDEASGTLAMRWKVPGIGEFAYENDRIELVRSDGEWLVSWSDRVVHPALGEPGERLGTERAFGERGPILGAGGEPLVEPRPVVEVGIVAGELSERAVERAITAVAVATEADAKALRRSVAAASSPDNFVPAITLRAEEFARVADELDVPGVESGARELPLAPTREFARALLGTVGPATAEQLEELGEPYAPGDNVGQFGLQAEHERRLAGTPDRSVVVRGADGVPVDTLLEVEGERGRALRTTLDPRAQSAAEAALGKTGDVTALVALEPATGDVLASASRPIDDAFNRAFEGRYPPGSTFKVVTTAALLAGGLDPSEIVDCPPTITVGGRSFRNFEGGAAGAVPFRRDFAESCNTAFISLAGRLQPDALRDAGGRFGLGAEYEIGVPAFSGDVPVTRDEVDQAAAMIGQGEILASPLAMAGVAATVADGRWRASRILASDPRDALDPLAAAQLAELRSLMREVVTSGTGTALADVPGGVMGKSGTAEYGTGDPPPTHAWFIAARDDVAVAVLVEDKPSGGEFAAPIAARFFEKLE